MATPIIQVGLATGEVSPSVYGRVDLDREHLAGTTIRNAFVSYRGGVNSRAGSAFVGFSKQTGRQFPPRLIPFQFSADQGLALEFGNFYMRVISDGAFVTELPVAIGSISQSDPAVLGFGAQGAVSATPNDAGVTFSYAPGDTVTLAGGEFLNPATLMVTTSQLISILPNNRGTGYAINDTITLAGGVATTDAVIRVATLAAVAASGFITFAANPSDGDTITLHGATWTFVAALSGAAQTLIQTTLGGTLAQLAIDLNASGNALLTVATYSSTTTRLNVVYDTTGAGGNAYGLVASVATPSAATLLGGTTTGVGTLAVTNSGVFTALPGSGNMTQASTSGGGSLATFQAAVFGPKAVTIQSPGAYTIVPSNPVPQSSTSGIGEGATFTMTWAAVEAFSNGDWIAISGVTGMTELNGSTFVVTDANPLSISLLDVYGDPVDSTTYSAYLGGGVARRIYTLPTQYAEEDLKYLKFTQSADVMSLCCVNQRTGVEYPPQDLSRMSDTDWSFSGAIAVQSVSPPAETRATISGNGTTFYQYVVTAVSPIDGTESTASPSVEIQGVAISVQQGQVNLTWTAVPEVQEYNIYKAQPSFGQRVPGGSLLGYIGSAYGVGFTDANIVPAFTQVPPQRKNPFARGQVIGANVISPGSGYTAINATIVTSTGSGAQVNPVLLNGSIAAFIIDPAGEGYLPTDTIVITGNGIGATATLVVGAQDGTYPSVPSYFQQRRVYANSLRAPDTYWMSQPGAFKNFDSRIPTIDSDAIVGSPWAVQVNGIQFMVQTYGGLLVLTGQSAWLLVGAGTFATNVQPISPSSQVATPQPFTGCSPTVPPIKINYDVLYVTAKGSFYYDLPFQLQTLSEPLDLTQYSTHLFVGYTIVEHAWCEQPYKVLWSVRDDGTMLSLTYLKAEQLAGWTRHDTDGIYCSVCSVTEPPVDALYMATQRFPGDKTAYMIERANNRIWQQVEDCWCVDSGLSLAQPTPNATIAVDFANGTGSITGVTELVGGEGYSASTQASVIDDNGEGTGAGAVPILTIVGGVITGISFVAQGFGYTRPALQIIDPENSGSGASARLMLNTQATFTANGPVFVGGDVGSVLRMGGGIATVTEVISSQVVKADISTPISALRPNSGGQVLPQPSGQWTLTKPVMKVFGLGHLAGATVTGLADGKYITPRAVKPDGTIDLDEPASSIVVGLGFQAQVQSVYLDAGAPTVQGQRKKVAAASVLVENSFGFTIGSNQVDGSTLSPPQNAPEWFNMDAAPKPDSSPERPYNSDVDPLFTGYVRIPVTGGFAKQGQVALQQDKPYPLNVLSLVSEFLAGDIPEQEVHARGQQR